MMLQNLGNYGVDKVLNVTNKDLETFNAKAYADVIQQAAEKESTKVVVVSSSVNSKYLAPLLAINLNAGYASNVLEVPSSTSPFIVKRNAFTNKAFEMFQINTEVKLLGVSKNTFGLHENKANATSEAFSVIYSRTWRSCGFCR